MKNKPTSQLSRALVALKKMRAKVEKLEQAKNEPIAVIGMGCRLPGEANDPEAFWRLLSEGVDAITEIPPSRWDVDAFYDSKIAVAGKMYTRSGGFLDQVDLFDPEFFGISPREAVGIDPQQRLLLEVSWEALEHAGLAPDKLVGSQTGVFTGICFNDYAQLGLYSGDVNTIDPYNVTGNGQSIIAGRISYVLGLEGPSMALDTACSSSLLAIHLACQSLRLGECNLALAGGVNLMLRPEVTVGFSQLHALAPDGRCKTFDASANGYARGEGSAVVVLKRLSDALADGDRILALVRGSAVNHDGRSNGLTAPNGAAQEAVIRQALASANLEPTDISYVEAHGTGTSLGDPIEVQALGSVLGNRSEPLMVGSVKTNFGHLESAAGIAGFIKVVLALQHEAIPPHLHFSEPSPYIPWHEWPITVPTSLTPWVSNGSPRRAGLSSFGMSGTNAHLILQEAPKTQPDSIKSDLNTQTTAESGRLHLLTLSAKTEEALHDLLGQYEKHLAANPSLRLEDLCFTANGGRAHFEHRLAILTDSTADLAQKVQTRQAGKKNSRTFQGQILETRKPKIAFLFTGQGSQYVGMGRELYQTNATFRQTFDYCAEVLRAYLKDSILDVLHPAQEADNSSPVHEKAYAQPALFALEYALAQVWKSWGIEPDFVMGHSMGEYAAACVAGLFSLDDGLKLIAERTRLMNALPPTGQMVSVRASQEQVAAIIEPYKPDVSIAVINGPQSVVISGRHEPIKKIVGLLKDQNIKIRELTIPYASHCALVEPILAPLKRAGENVTYFAPQTALVSNVTGDVASATLMGNAEYWCRHIRQPVKFMAGIEALEQQGVDIFVEIGPKPTLSAMGRNCVTNEYGTWLPSLRSGRSDWQQMLSTLANLYVHGVSVDWAGFHNGNAAHKVILPTYPFQRQRYWASQPTSVSSKNGKGNTWSPILELLDQGDSDQLLQRLDSVSNLSAEEQQLLPKLLGMLSQQHRQLANQALDEQNDDQGELYEVSWQNKAAKTESQFKKTGNWFIFADQGGVGEALAEQLRTQGQHTTLLYATQDLTSSQEQVELALDSLNHEPPLKGIVHLWGLDSPPLVGLSSSALIQAQRETSGSVLHLVQALSQPKAQKTAKLWVVTQGAVSVASHLPRTQSQPIALNQAPLWGLGTVIGLEHPELWGGMIDLDHDDQPAKAAAQLLKDIGNSAGEEQIAWRESTRYVARLLHTEPRPIKKMRWQADYSYLMTGGVGALGLQVARWMVKQGARHLVLTSRRGVSGEAQEVISQLEEQGAHVLVVKADVSEESDVARMLAEINLTMPPLRGIIHAAGVSVDGLLSHQSWAQFEQVMAPKVQGTWNLHMLTKELALDFFVCFSSMTAVLGSIGVGNYAAANAFMDTFARYRSALGWPTVSINWAPWAASGMANNSRYEAHLQSLGITPITPKQALQQFQQVLDSYAQVGGQVGVLKIDWQQYNRGRQQPLIKGLLTEEKTDQGQSFIQRLEEADDLDREGLLIEHLCEQVTEILELTRSPALSQGFTDMGMDSLMAVELKNRLENSLGRGLPATLALEYPTIESLKRYLTTEVLAWDTRSDELLSDESDAFADDLLADIALFSDQDLADLIDTELEMLINA